MTPVHVTRCWNGTWGDESARWLEEQGRGVLFSLGRLFQAAISGMGSQGRETALQGVNCEMAEGDTGHDVFKGESERKNGSERSE